MYGGVVVSAVFMVDSGVEWMKLHYTRLWLFFSVSVSCVRVREEERMSTQPAQHRALNCQWSKSFTLWAGKWVEEWRGKTVKITNNILTLCLTPVFMSYREIKEVFTEFGFHMSASTVWVVWGGAGCLAEYLRINSSQAPLSAASADFVNDWGGRKEMEALLLIELDLS